MKTKYHKPCGDIGNDYLPINKAASVASLNLANLYDAIRDGRLKYVMIAPQTARIRLSDLNEFIVAQKWRL